MTGEPAMDVYITSLATTLTEGDRDANVELELTERRKLAKKREPKKSVTSNTKQGAKETTYVVKGGDCLLYTSEHRHIYRYTSIYD